MRPHLLVFCASTLAASVFPAQAQSVAPREKTPAGLSAFPDAILHGEPSIAWRRWQAADLPPIPVEGLTVALNCSLIVQPLPMGDIPPLAGMIRCKGADNDARSEPFVEAAALRSIHYVFDLGAVPRDDRRDRRDVGFAVKFSPDEQKPLDLAKRPLRKRSDFEWKWAPELKTAEFFWHGQPMPSGANPQVKLTCQVQADLSLSCDAAPLDPVRGRAWARDAARLAAQFESPPNLTTGEPAVGAVTEAFVRFFDQP